MKIAILSDIHGNYRALLRCLEHAKEQKVDAYIFLGDYLGEFAYPQKTMEIIYDIQKQHTCFFLRGNKEDYWIDRRRDINCEWENGNQSIVSMQYNYENLKSDDIDYFESLPICKRICFDGMTPILVCHGTPFANNLKLLPGNENVKKVIDQCAEKYIICGHTHIQGPIYDKEKKIINAGAVGVPLNSPKKTQYLIMEADGSEWKSTFYSLEYDVDEAIRDIHESGLWDKTPHWCRITEHLLYTGEISHGTVLNYVMKLNEYKDPWYNIDSKYWEKALRDLGIKNDN